MLLRIVTKIKLPKFSDICMPSIKYYSNCSFIQEANFNTAGNNGKEIKQNFMVFLYFTSSLYRFNKEKGEAIQDTIESLLEEDIPSALKAEESQSLRYERALVGLVPALSGLETVVIKSLSSCLQKRRNKAMAKGLQKLKRNQNLQYNRLYELVSGFLLYGKYNAVNTEKIVLIINPLQKKPSCLEGLFLGIKNEWSSYFLFTGIEYFIISYHLQLYLHECSERHNRLYEALLNSLHNV